MHEKYEVERLTSGVIAGKVCLAALVGGDGMTLGVAITEGTTTIRFKRE